MFGTLNPKIPATRAADSTLKWSAKGLALNSTIVTSVNTGNNYVYFNQSTGSVYAYLNTSLLAGAFVPYTGAQANVNIGMYSFLSDSSGVTISYTDYPSSSLFTTTYPNIVQYSASGSYSGGSGYFTDYYGDGYLYDSSSYYQIGTIDYTTGAINTSAFYYDTIYTIYYSYQPPSAQTSISYGGSNFDNGITVSKDGASYAARFSDLRYLATFCDDFRAALFYDTTTGHSAQFCNGVFAVSAIGISYFNAGGTSVTLNDLTFAVNATGDIIIHYDSPSDRVKLILQNTDDSNDSGSILWRGSEAGYSNVHYWELGNDYGKDGTHDFFLYDHENSELRFKINSSKQLEYFGDIKIFGESYFGDGGTSDYTRLDTTGHQTMSGAAKPWEDLRIEPNVRGTGANNPTFEKYYDDAAGTSRGVYLYSFDDAATNSQKEVFFTMQMPHEWDGGAINMHVHWVGNTSDTDATPIWGLEYVWKDIGEVFGDTTIVYTTSGNLDGSGSADPDVTAGKHYLSSFDVLTPDTTNDGLSSILIGRLFRRSGDASDTYNVGGNKCGLLYIDAHYQKNSLGSTDEYTK